MSSLADKQTEPLGDQIEHFLGQTAHELGQAERRATFNRGRWLSILHDHERLPAFLSSLSACQLSSHQLLRGWLTVRLEDAGAETEAIKAQDLLRRENDGEAGQPSLHSYHYHLANLFSCEFSCPGEGVPVALFRATLQQARRDAALHASCHRLATRYCLSLAGIQKDDSDSLENIEWPQYGASIDPCSWLKRQDTEQGMPHYLWDVKRKRTMLVKDIMATSGKPPEYMAISHTWGRWIKEKEPWILLPSLQWKIPQNERFEVSDLPQLFENLPCEYVWFDLLTIPQGSLSKEMYDLQRTEIARQAVIFRSATSAVAWFNNIHAWCTLPSTIRFLCHEYLRHFNVADNSDKELFHMPDGDLAAANAFIDLFDPHEKEKQDPNHRKPNPWFTSLWTLQEVCLRPDMWLCNSKWEFLAICENTPIALNDLVALCLATSNMPIFKNRVPTGVRELQRLIRITELQSLLQLSQISIITMGNQRHCKKRRAEAIMSAIGAVDWFRDFQNSSMGEEDDDEFENDADDDRLLLGLYPLPFVNEIRERLGSCSFFSSTPLGWQFHTVLYKYCSEKRTKKRKFEALGSMLPIGPGAQAITFETESTGYMAQHPALDSWTIESTGCVRIRQAGIVSSSFSSSSTRISPKKTGPLRCLLIAPSAGNDENRLVMQGNTDLHQWIQEYKPWSPNVAICLSYSSLSSRGIILKEMEEEGVLLKIGSYWEFERPGYEMPEPQEVDWLVM